MDKIGQDAVPLVSFPQTSGRGCIQVRGQAGRTFSATGVDPELEECGDWGVEASSPSPENVALPHGPPLGKPACPAFCGPRGRWWHLWLRPVGLGPAVPRWRKGSANLGGQQLGLDQKDILFPKIQELPSLPGIQGRRERIWGLSTPIPDSYSCHSNTQFHQALRSSSLTHGQGAPLPSCLSPWPSLDRSNGKWMPLGPWTPGRLPSGKSVWA